jgi:23S rRNA 5-hydroxycytidine C2501 synthase
MASEQVKAHLSSTGNTPFKVTKVNLPQKIGFLPIRFLNGIKRHVLEELERIRIERYSREKSVSAPNDIPYPQKNLDFHANVYNGYARRFYKRHGAEVLEPAFERLADVAGREVMHSRYCLRYELDACLKPDQSIRKIKAPLRIGDGHHIYELKFDCQACRMSVVFLGKK